MQDCNLVISPYETNLKLEKCEEESLVGQTLFKQIVGSLRYLSSSRPDITYGIGLIIRFIEDPRTSQLVMAKRILRLGKEFD